MTTLLEPARETPIRHEADVLVVGGGSAGVAAAVAAARRGADVLLVERHGYLGGLATGGLIILLLSLDDGRGRQAVAGLCHEAVGLLDARGAAFHPSPDEWGSDDSALVERDQRWGLVWGRAPHRVRYSVAYDPAMLKGVLDAMLQEAGARVLLHAWACEPILDGDRIAAVVFQGKSGRFAIRARVVIDATGDGDVFYGAGCAHESEQVLPWMWFTAGGVDVDRALAAGASCFQTVGPGKVLFPWGSIEKVGRIDATRPEDLTLRRARVQAPRAGRVRAAAPRGSGIRGRPPVRGGRPARHHREPPPAGSTRHDPQRHEPGDCPTPSAVTGHWTKYGAVYHDSLPCPAAA